MAASYISPHHGGGWLYQHHVPVALRGVLWGTGTKKAAFRHYLKRMPRREAEAKARELAVRHSATIAACREVPEQERAAIAAAGGLNALISDPKIPTSQLDERYVQKPDLFWRRLLAEAIQHQANKKEGNPSADLVVSWEALLADWISH
jgi:hypothetical protein